MNNLLNKFSIIFLVFITTPAYAGLQVAVSANYLNINDAYTRTNSLGKPAISYGYNYIYKPLVISATTNRLFNQASEQQVSKKGVSFLTKTRITADTLLVGYAGRISPFGFITNAGVDKSLYRDNKLLGRTKQYALLYGGGINYVYDKSFTFSAAVIAPNKELDLKYGLNFGVIYNL